MVKHGSTGCKRIPPGGAHAMGVDDLGFSGCRIEPASADASFRRSFALPGADTCIVMDAPPDKEMSHRSSASRSAGRHEFDVPPRAGARRAQGLTALSI